MVSSISSSDDSIQQMMALMLQNMQSADTDGTSGLSKDELSSIDTNGDQGGTAFLKSLQDQFSQLDTDGNGQLSNKEISSAKPPEPMGPPPGFEIDSIEDTSPVDSTEETQATEATTTESTSMTIDEILEKIIKELMEKMAEKFDGSDSENSASDGSSVDLAAADTDKTKGLSADELSAINTSDNKYDSNFIQNLLNNFDYIDSNSNGQLSQAEIEAFKPKETSSLSDGLKSPGNASTSFLQKLLSSYQNSNIPENLSNLASSLNISV